MNLGIPKKLQGIAEPGYIPSLPTEKASSGRKVHARSLVEKYTLVLRAIEHMPARVEPLLLHILPVELFA